MGRNAVAAGALLLFSLVGLGCGASSELTVVEAQSAEAQPAEKESPADAKFFGGRPHVADGVAVLVPAYVADDEGGTTLEDSALSPSRWAFVARNSTDVERVALDGLPLGDQVPDLLAVGTDAASTKLLVGRCRPTTNAEYGVCDEADAQTWWVYELAEDGTVKVVGDELVLDGSIRSAAPNADGSGFVALLGDAAATSLSVIDIDWTTGQVSELGAVDDAFVDDSSVCVDGSATTWGYDGSDGDRINLHAQSVGGKPTASSLGWDDGWFQELHCGVDGAAVLTSFGALYSLTAGFESERTLEISPLGRKQGVRVESVRGADGQVAAVVAAAFGESETGEASEAVSADVRSGRWDQARGLADALSRVRPGFAVTLDGETLVPFGVISEDGTLYTIGAR